MHKNKGDNTKQPDSLNKQHHEMILGTKLSSSLQLFADDFVFYRTDTFLEDSKQLQCDLRESC